MTGARTQSGIPGLGDVAWGDHVCHFYGSREDLTESLVPYFKAGLDNHEQCYWITSDPLGAQDASSALAAAVPDLATRQARGEIIIVGHEEWYTSGGAMDPMALIGVLREREQQALAHGYEGIRISGNSYWLPPEAWHTMAEYESLVSEAMHGLRIVALCSYCLHRCTSTEALDVVSRHSYGLTRRASAWSIIEPASVQTARQELLRLSRAAELHEQLLGMVTHDLRNPLNSILLAARTLADMDAELHPSSRRQLHGRIVRSAQRMSQLIDDLLDFTRVRVGQGVPIRTAPDDINAICRAVCEELELVHPTRTIALELEAQGAGSWDRARLAQAIGNVVANALQYSPAGSTVTVRSHELRTGNHDQVCIEVHNQGEPIPDDLLPRLFQPFHRGRHHDPSGGLGLGLFIARWIVDAHGGHIDVCSSREHGTTFALWLPRVSVPGAALLPE